MSSQLFTRMIMTAMCGLRRPLNAAVDCTVKVNYEAVGTSNKDLLQDFERNVRSYINDFQWGSDQIEEKVHCTVDIFVQRVVGENKYMAQVFIGSQRPIYGGNKNTAVVRLFDEAWEFTMSGAPAQSYAERVQ
jgi:hypothetical protein